MTPKNKKACLLYYIKLCVSFQIHQWFQTGATVRKCPIWVKFKIFWAVWPCNLTYDLKKQQGTSFMLLQVCAPFRSHWWIQTGVTVRKHPIWVKIDTFLAMRPSNFYGWPWKTIGHFFYAIPSFVHHFVGISDFKLEIQSGNAQFGPKLAIFSDVWPCNLTYALEKLLGTSSILLQALCIFS